MQFWGLSCVFVPSATWLLIIAMSCLWAGCFDSRICPRRSLWVASRGWGARCLTCVFLVFCLIRVCLTFSGREALWLAHSAPFPVIQAVPRTLINQGGTTSRMALDEGVQGFKVLIPGRRLSHCFYVGPLEHSTKFGSLFPLLVARGVLSPFFLSLLHWPHVVCLFGVVVLFAQVLSFSECFPSFLHSGPALGGCIDTHSLADRLRRCSGGGSLTPGPCTSHD